MKDSLNMGRLKQLFYIEVFITYKYLLASLLVPLVFSFFLSLNSDNDIFGMFPMNISIYKAYIFLGGIMFTSYSFIEIHKKLQSHFWFMLPANLLEKFVMRVFTSLVYYFTFITLGFVVVILISHLFFLEHSSFSTINSFFSEIFFPNSVDYFKDYMFLNAIFLLGAIVFKKRMALYTIISSAVFFILLVLLVLAFVKFGIEFGFFTLDENGKHFLDLDFGNFVTTHMKTSLFLLFVFTMWFITYKIMRKKQVSDGI